MKKFFFSVIIICIACGCGQNESDMIETNALDPTCLDVDTKKAFDEFSLEEERIYIEARNRIDETVIYSHGHFQFTENDPRKLNISPRLFEHFKQLMTVSNQLLDELNELPNQGLISIGSTVKRIKTRSEFDQPNSSGIDPRWYGFDLYLSNSDLVKIAALAASGGVIANYLPPPYNKYVGGPCGVTSALASLGAAYYPSGVVVSFTPNPTIGGCTPFYFEGQ